MRAGELFIGDRAYGAAPGIAHVVGAGGDVLVRFPWSHLNLRTRAHAPFDLFAHLRTLRGTRVGDWPVAVPWQDDWLVGRVCASKKSRHAAEKAWQKARRTAQKNGSIVQPETLEAAGYVLAFYRGRWQIELVFKRLKSLMDCGHLRKVDPDAARSWIHGKLLVAFLVEAFLRERETRFPWGDPMREGPAAESLPVA